MDFKEVYKNKRVNRHPWEVARLEVIHKLLQAYYPNIYNSNHTVFDWGCGDSFITQQLAESYPKSKFIGFDPAIDSQFCQEILQRSSVPNLEIFHSLDQISGLKESIDIVLLLDVLEHFRDDTLFLKEILSNKIIKEKAIFFIVVPAFQSLFSSHDRLLNHYHRYNHKQLLQTISKVSIEPIKFGYFFSSLFIVRFFQKILEKASIISPKSESPLLSWNGGDLLNQLLKQLLIYDFNVTQFFRKSGILLPGISCYVIGQRQ